MAGFSLARAIAACLFCVLAAGVATAQAQNYEGPGLLKVGVFLQGSLTDGKLIKYDSTSTLVATGSSSLDSIGGGMSAGYDYRFGNFLLGVEADGALASGDARIGGEKFHNDYFTTARGRIGMFLTPRLVAYATAGWAGMGLSWHRSDVPVTSSALTVNAMMSGWTVGGGAELDMPGYILFAEYLHADFGTWGFNDFAGNNLRVNANADVIRIGAKFKVGFDYHPM